MLVAPGLHGLRHQPEPKSPGLFVPPHPAMGLEGMPSALNHPELCLTAGYKVKFLPKACAVNLVYFEGVTGGGQTLLGQVSGFVDVEPVHECQKVVVGSAWLRELILIVPCEARLFPQAPLGVGD